MEPFELMQGSGGNCVQVTVFDTELVPATTTSFASEPELSKLRKATLEEVEAGFLQGPFTICATCKQVGPKIFVVS